MHKPVIVIGLGEMGSVFARGLLRSGYAVYPVLRETDMQALAQEIIDPALVLVAVAENDLQSVLKKIPVEWRHKLVLLQNELLPADWQTQGLQEPTVISVWFEKKKGQDVKVIIPSPVYGPLSATVHDALATIDIPVNILSSSNALLFELAVKNVYILTTNIAGLKTGGDVGQLWAEHRDVATAIAGEVVAIQQALTGEHFNSEALIQAMLVAFEGDPQHKCMGRSAPARLRRALQLAEQHGVDVPNMRAIANQLDR